MTGSRATNHVTTPKQSCAVQAYLLTISEDYANTPVFGATFMKEVTTAFSSPNELRALLPPSSRGRFDWWLEHLLSHQYELFQEPL